MSVKKRDEERKEEGPLKIFCLSLSLLAFFSFQEGGEEEVVVVVHVARELSGPLLLDPL